MLKLQEQIRLALGERSDCVFWRNQSGQYEAFPIGKQQAKVMLNKLKSGNVASAIAMLETALAGGSRWIRYGLGKGGSDLIGMVNNSGRLIALEVKDGRDTMKPDQLMFQELVRKFGGYAAEVRSVEDAIKALELSK